MTGWTLFQLFFGTLIVINLILMGLYTWTYIRVKKVHMNYIKNVCAIMIVYTIAESITYISDCGLVLSPQAYPTKTNDTDTNVPIVSFINSLTNVSNGNGTIKPILMIFFSLARQLEVVLEISASIWRIGYLPLGTFTAH